MPKDNYATCDKCGEPIATSEDSHWEESKVFHKSCLAMPFSDAALDETRKVKLVKARELLNGLMQGTVAFDTVIMDSKFPIILLAFLADYDALATELLTARKRIAEFIEWLESEGIADVYTRERIIAQLTTPKESNNG